MKLNWLDHAPEALDDFHALESKPVEHPVLALPQSRRPHMINIDASVYTLGAVSC